MGEFRRSLPEQNAANLFDRYPLKSLLSEFLKAGAEQKIIAVRNFVSALTNTSNQSLDADRFRNGSLYALLLLYT